nr:MAG TPA: hypothetical protein [Caudoviricetes sp.]
MPILSANSFWVKPLDWQSSFILVLKSIILYSFIAQI